MLASAHNKPVLKTFYIVPNLFLQESKERIRNDLEYLKNRLKKLPDGQSSNLIIYITKSISKTLCMTVLERDSTPLLWKIV